MGEQPAPTPVSSGQKDGPFSVFWFMTMAEVCRDIWMCGAATTVGHEQLAGVVTWTLTSGDFGLQRGKAPKIA